jgi:nucleotide-binding universal stress UspA family protein
LPRIRQLCPAISKDGVAPGALEKQDKLKRKRQPPSETPMKNLLVPVDFSRISRFVIAEALRLARATKSRVTLLHVVQPPTVMTDYGPLLENVVQFTSEAEKDAARHLSRLKAKLKESGIAVDTVLKTGAPVLHILEQAKKIDPSYLVLGTHGHTAFYDLIVGSTTGAVLKRATCPVLVVPPPPGEKKFRTKKKN